MAVDTGIGNVVGVNKPAAKAAPKAVTKPPVTRAPATATPAPPSVPAPTAITETGPVARPNPATTSSTSPAQLAVFQGLAAQLSDAGLANLFTYTNGKPGGWLWDTIVVGGLTTPQEVQAALESNADYQKRFAVIFEQRKLAGQGVPVQVMTAAEVRSYEDSARSIMRQYKLPAAMYDSFTDLQNLMVKGVSLNQLNQAIGISYQRVANTDPAIRQAFKDFYGNERMAGQDGEAMLAAYFLDPDHIDSNLDKFSRAAAIAGTGRNVGLNLGRSQAEALANMGLDESTAHAGLTKISDMRDLFSETATESKDLTAEDQGVASVFGTNATGANEVKVRQQQRQAAFAGGGGAIQTSAGLIGLQEAR